MRPVFENGAPVPAFLNKLWKMVDDEKTDNLISWSPGGQSFIIKHQGDFCTKLLPQFYKHSNMASFVRQLNMYGFHKVSNIESGVHKGEREEIEFIHLYFKKGEPTLVEKIKRKMSSRMAANNTADGKNMEMMTKVLEDVAQMRGRQLSLDAQLATMKQHNVALWRELSLLRRKHHKQQQIVNKLIQFLVSLVQPSRNNINGLGVKRRYPLMINDIAQSNAKQTKIPRNSDDRQSGPTIHELDNTDTTLLEEAGMLEDYIEPVIEIHSPESQRTRSSTNSSTKTKSSPILFDFEDSSLPCDDDDKDLEDDDDDECPLSSDLLFATNPHLVTPTLRKKPQAKKQTKSSSVRKNKKQGIRRIPTPEEIDEDDILSDLSNDATMIDAIIQPKDPSSSNNNDEMETIMLSSDDANILKAAAHEFGFIIANDDDNNTIIQNDNILQDSVNDLNELLQTTAHTTAQTFVKNDGSNVVTTAPPITVTLANNVDSGGGNENLSSKTMCAIEPPSTSYTPAAAQAQNLDGFLGSSGETDTDNRTVATVQTPDQNQLNSVILKNGYDYRSDLDNHLYSMQTELDSLKDLLVGEGYSIDANALLGLFGSDDPMSYTLSMPNNEYDNPETVNNMENGQNNNGIHQNTDSLLSGSELMCAPTFDFDMFSTPDNTIMATPENSMDATDVKNLQFNNDTFLNNENNTSSPLTPHFPLNYDK